MKFHASYLFFTSAAHFLYKPTAHQNPETTSVFCGSLDVFSFQRPLRLAAEHRGNLIREPRPRCAESHPCPPSLLAEGSPHGADQWAADSGENSAGAVPRSSRARREVPGRDGRRHDARPCRAAAAPPPGAPWLVRGEPRQK